MPRVKPLIRPDPLEDELISEIGAGMAVKKMTILDLADKTGINYSTLKKRLRGDIKSLRIGELILIRKVLRG